MCLDHASQFDGKFPLSGFKEFGFCVTKGHNDLLQGMYHGGSYDFDVKYEAQETQLVSIFNTPYISGFHSYFYDEYLLPRIKRSDFIIARVTLDKIHTVGIQDAIPVYVSKYMTINSLVFIPERHQNRFNHVNWPKHKLFGTNF